MFLLNTLSTPNYDNLLLGWSQLSLQNNVEFNGGNSKYSIVAAEARQGIITNFAWTIIDGGPASEGPHAIPGYKLVFFVAALGVTIALVIIKKYDKKSQIFF